jgi:hypothetical protein
VLPIYPKARRRANDSHPSIGMEELFNQPVRGIFHGQSRSLPVAFGLQLLLVLTSRVRFNNVHDDAASQGTVY